MRQPESPNIAIITSYNDMLSAHHSYGSYPEQLKEAVAGAGGVAQVAGGVPAMCDGVTQGEPGMDLSLISRDVIAQSVVIALSHNMFDGVLLLGICDKVLPGLLMGGLQFGHLPMMLVPGGPMPSGIPNREKAAARERFAQGERPPPGSASPRARSGRTRCSTSSAGPTTLPAPAPFTEPPTATS
jgi:phosphogluconate dehydratase